MRGYGKELILDLHGCNTNKFNRFSIVRYLKELCEEIDMERCDLHFWDDLDTPEDEKQTSPQTTGTSAIQFILTSNITIHTLDKLEKVFINIFSCKDFDAHLATAITIKHFKGKVANRKVVDRL